MPTRPGPSLSPRPSFTPDHGLLRWVLLLPHLTDEKIEGQKLQEHLSFWSQAIWVPCLGSAISLQLLTWRLSDRAPGAAHLSLRPDDIPGPPPTPPFRSAFWWWWLVVVGGLHCLPGTSGRGEEGCPASPAPSHLHPSQPPAQSGNYLVKLCMRRRALAFPNWGQRRPPHRPPHPARPGDIRSSPLGCRGQLVCQSQGCHPTPSNAWGGGTRYPAPNVRGAPGSSLPAPTLR